MHSGYVLCTLDNLKVLCITKDKKGVELVEFKRRSDLNKALCLTNLTSIKGIYQKFKDHALVPDLDIVNVAKLYNRCL